MREKLTEMWNIERKISNRKIEKYKKDRIQKMNEYLWNFLWCDIQSLGFRMKLS